MANRKLDRSIKIFLYPYSKKTLPETSSNAVFYDVVCEDSKEGREYRPQNDGRNIKPFIMIGNLYQTSIPVGAGNNNVNKVHSITFDCVASTPEQAESLADGIERLIVGKGIQLYDFNTLDTNDKSADNNKVATGIYCDPSRNIIHNRATGRGGHIHQLVVDYTIYN